FEVSRTGSGYRFTGRGAGHGVGLCVLGSTRLAAKGHTADAILARYFPGLRLGRVDATEAPQLAQTALRVLLPEADERDRDVVLAIARRSRDALSRALGITPPAGMTLR